MNITYSSTHEFSENDLRRLFLSVNWESGNHPDKLQIAMRNYASVFSAWAGDKLVGLVCVMDDGIMTAYIQYVLVDPEYQGQGIGRDLLKEPGLARTLLGDGVGSMAGAFFGGCPNTTYGESVGCVAITGNASTVTIIAAAIGCILFSFVTPFVAFVDSIPSCVMGGVCVALYGFIAVSGLKMLKEVDLDDNRNLFTASVIFIAGIGGLSISFGKVTLTEIAAALILGILTNVMLSKKKDSSKNE